MKIMNHRIEMLKNLLAASLIAFALPAIGQQMNFSQYRLTPLLNNPSLIATSEEIKADFGYRNQFGGKQGNFSTPFLSGYMPLYTKTSNDQFKKFGAAGVQLLTDRTGYNGMLATTGFSVAYSHIATLSKIDRIAFGLQPGLFQRRVDFSRLSTGSQWDGFNGAYDPNRPINESTSVERRTFFTINAGVTYIRENSIGEPVITVSLGANNLSRPNISLNSKTFSNPINWNVQASVLAFENEQFQIKPTFRHVLAFNLNQTNLGSYFYYKLSEKGSFITEGNIGLGLWYSNQNALVTALEINQRDWAIGISYDFITSALADASNRTGAPEIIVGFRKYIGKRKKSADINASGSGGGGHKNDEPSKVDDPKKSNPSNTEMNQEPVAKPVEVVPTPTEKPVEPVVKPTDGQSNNDIAEPKPVTKPVVKQTKKAPAKAAAKKKTSAKKPVAKKSSASKKRAASNISPELRKKLEGVITPDEYLGDDPYKGTSKALTPDQRRVMKRQPRFNLGGFEIDDVAAEQLDEIAEIMKTRPKIKLEIGGYGCDKGGPEITKQTSLGRAESVRRYLALKGVPAEQLETKSYGLENPIRSNKDEEGRAANRRVQLRFLP